MRVLFLSTTMGMGGADQLLLTVAGGLRARGHEVMIASLTPLGPMGLEARQLGIATESLKMRRGVPDPRGLVRLARLVRAWKPDVLHSHMVHANLLARVVRLIAPVPALVSTIHSIYDGGRLRMAAYRLSNRLVDQMTIVSQAAADRFISERIIPRELLRVLPNSVDTDRFRNLPPGTRESVRRSLGLQGQFAWLAVGRFEVAKDYPNMLRAFARRSGIPSLLLLVGAVASGGNRDSDPGPGARRQRALLGVRRTPEVMSARRLRDVLRLGGNADRALRPRLPDSPSLPHRSAESGGRARGERLPSRPAIEALGQAMLRLMGLSDRASALGRGGATRPDPLRGGPGCGAVGGVVRAGALAKRTVTLAVAWG
jgi:glycosyltransferase involved in cell wall biosynthesis